MRPYHHQLLHSPCLVLEKVDFPKIKLGEFMSKTGKTYRYSDSFKHELLSQIREDKLTVLEAGKYYGVPYQTIYKWLRKNNVPNPSQEVFYVSKSDKHDLIKKNEALFTENQLLKEAISKLTIDKICLETLVDLAKTEYNVDLKKNLNIRVSRKSEK